MTLNDLKASLTGATPPSGLSPLLLALWHDAKGDNTRPIRREFRFKNKRSKG
jgi:hypothetical protein